VNDFSSNRQQHPNFAKSARLLKRARFFFEFIIFSRLRRRVRLAFFLQF